MKLANKIAVITGAGSGIGKATAILFAKEGAKVVIADINDAGGNETASAVMQNGGEAVFVHSDVSQASEVKNLVKSAIDRFARIDILFNNAGMYMKRTRIEDVEESLWDRIYAVNVKGVFQGVKFVVPEMKKAGGGVIINTASVAGYRGSQLESPYSSSKGAVITLTKALATELAPSRIRVNCICPGLTETAMFFASDIWERASAAPHPLGRLNKPEDIAYAALYLACDESAMITGTCLDVNGGQVV